MFTPVYTKATKRSPSFKSDYEAEIRVGNSISIKRGETISLFHLGDMAEYDSYNLSYYGKIVSIGPKTVTIVERHNSTRHRISVYEFAWRNIDFTVDETSKSNSETMGII